MSVVKILGDVAGGGWRGFAIAAIEAYQRWLSPYKGFRCAHRVLHGGRSCSQFVKVAIATRPWPEALQLSRQRLVACGQAKRQLQILRSQSAEESQREADPKTWRPRRSSYDNWCQMFLGECCGASVAGCDLAIAPSCSNPTDLGCDDCGCDISG